MPEARDPDVVAALPRAGSGRDGVRLGGDLRPDDGGVVAGRSRRRSADPAIGRGGGVPARRPAIPSEARSSGRRGESPVRRCPFSRGRCDGRRCGRRPPSARPARGRPPRPQARSRAGAGGRGAVTTRTGGACRQGSGAPPHRSVARWSRSARDDGPAWSARRHTGPHRSAPTAPDRSVAGAGRLDECRANRGVEVRSPGPGTGDDERRLLDRLERLRVDDVRPRRTRRPSAGAARTPPGSGRCRCRSGSVSPGRGRRRRSRSPSATAPRRRSRSRPRRGCRS